MLSPRPSAMTVRNWETLKRSGRGDDGLEPAALMCAVQRFPGSCEIVADQCASLTGGFGGEITLRKFDRTAAGSKVSGIGDVLRRRQEKIGTISAVSSSLYNDGTR